MNRLEESSHHFGLGPRQRKGFYSYLTVTSSHQTFDIHQISLGLSIGRNLFWGLGWARVVDLGFGFGFGFGFATMPLALLWQSLVCSVAAVLALAE